MIRGVTLFCCLCLLTPYSTYAMTAEQKAAIHEHFEKLGMECIKDNVITEDDIVALRSKKVPTGENAPCFLACVMKKIGLLDANGMMQKEEVLDMARKVFDDEEEVKIIGDVLHSCSSVNSAPVSDGDKGCERAALAHKCMLENASQFNFDM